MVRSLALLVSLVVRWCWFRALRWWLRYVVWRLAWWRGFAGGHALQGWGLTMCNSGHTVPCDSTQRERGHGMSDYALQAEGEMWDAIASQPALNPAQELAARCAGVFGRNEDATLTATPDCLSSVAGHVEREYGSCGYSIGQVANASGGGVFSVRTSDGSTFYLAADRYGNVARFEPAS